jgi:tyrosyl-tRNA synthetase
MGQAPQQVFLVPLLLGTDGRQKMSKSLGNQIGVDEPPQEMYGKVMSIPDSLLLDYFELVTDVPDKEIAEFREQLNAGSVNPMNLKKRLAWEIVQQFYGRRTAEEAQEYFSKLFQRREIPEEPPEHAFAARYIGEELYQLDIAPTLVKEGIVKSNSELKRLIAQEAIELDGTKISNNIVTARKGSILKIGKRCFVKIVPSPIPSLKGRGKNEGEQGAKDATTYSRTNTLPPTSSPSYGKTNDKP